MRANRTLAILLAVVTVCGTVAVGSVGAFGASVDLSPEGVQDADDEASDDTTTNETDAGDNETANETEGNLSDGAAFALNLTSFIEELQESNETGPLGQLIAEFAVSNNPGKSVRNATLNVTIGPPENVTQGPPGDNETGPPGDNETGPPDDAGPGDRGGENGGGPPDDAGNGDGGSGAGQADVTDRFARTS